MLVEYIREAKNGEDKKTILFLVSNNNMCNGIIHTIKESMKGEIPPKEIIIWGVEKYKIKRELELLNRNRKF